MADIIIQPGTVYLAMVIVGIFSGLGSSIGQYIFTEHILRRLKRIKAKRK